MNIANEKPSVPLAPMKTQPYTWKDGHRGREYWNEMYAVCVRWDWLGKEPKDQTCAMIQICRMDGGSVLDWRDMQAIKTRVLGPDWEAVELYPAEDRLKDPSNARYLWAVRGKLPFGLPGGRIVLDAHEAIAPQRPFAAREAS